MIKCHRVGSFLIIVLALSPALAALSSDDGPFSLEQVLSSPFPSELIASPNRDKLAWVFYDKGRRNIWVAEAPDYRARQLTKYTEDDGQGITDLAFSPDGTRIAYARGGPRNMAGEHPNPTSDPGGARQEVLVADVRTGATTKIGEGENPFFSPGGDSVIFYREGKLWSAPAGGGPQKVSSAAFSPDGSKLAFVSSREDHSFIAIYELGPNRIRFIEPSVDRDIDPRWSPDGRRIAFIRLFNVADTYSIDRERIISWAIYVADVQSGQARQIWRSGNSKMESFWRVPGEDTLQWAAGDQLIFCSERDGWAHLYSVPASGGQTKLLTPGEYEVENVARSPDRSYVDRRHLWKVDLVTGSMQQITRGDGIEMNPVILSGGMIAFLGSTARDPYLPNIASADRSQMKRLAEDAIPKDFPSKFLAEPQPVSFKAADGLQIRGQLFKPRSASGKLPAVVFMHGGPQRQMLLDYRRYYHNAYAFNQYLASRGYVVLSVNYCSGIGYGRAFREAKCRGPRGASEYQDIVAAGLYLNHVGLWGGSYGGYLTAMGLARNSDIFAAGVDLDWSARVGRTPWDTSSPEMVNLGRESSPISSVDKWKSPVLLIHADDDRNVAFSQTVELIRKLRERGVKFELMVFPDDVHDFLLHGHWIQAYRAAADFLDKYLKGRTQDEKMG
jgi:dipeptidyl aminopeptidase/acylaminoacyl peptidase